MSETLEKFRQMKYNEKEEFELLEGYEKAREKQDINALVTFKVYKEVSAEIDRELVGKTFEGIGIKGKKTHFIDRIIGQYQESDYPQPGKRQGVKISEAIATLSEPVRKSMRENADGSLSLSLFGRDCRGVVDLNTGRLIHTNRIHGDKK